MERIIEPVVADIQSEYVQALRAGRWWRAARVRFGGYLVFWRAIGVYLLEASPRMVWHSIATD
jgi:hypothetical protein